MSLTITILGTPAPGGSKKVFRTRSGFNVVDDAKNNAGWRNSVAAQAVVAMAGRPPMTGPLAVLFHFYMPRPKGHYRPDGTVRPKAPPRPFVRPDATKLIRSVEDACTGIIWRDDAQIVIQSAEKIYENARGPRCVIMVDEVSP